MPTPKAKKILSGWIGPKLASEKLFRLGFSGGKPPQVEPYDSASSTSSWWPHAATIPACCASGRVFTPLGAGGSADAANGRPPATAAAAAARGDTKLCSLASSAVAPKTAASSRVRAMAVDRLQAIKVMPMRGLEARGNEGPSASTQETLSYLEGLHPIGL